MLFVANVYPRGRKFLLTTMDERMVDHLRKTTSMLTVLWIFSFLVQMGTGSAYAANDSHSKNPSDSWGSWATLKKIHVDYSSLWKNNRTHASH